MDYDKVSQTITTLLKSAAPEGGTTKEYSKIPAVDEQRDIIISHLKSTYTTETGEMINAKELVDISNTYKNMLTVAEGESDTVQTRRQTLEDAIRKQKDHIEKSKNVNNILKILVATMFLAVVNYAIGGPWVHGIAIILLIIGLGIALYTRGEISLIDFSSIKQWISTTLGL